MEIQETNLKTHSEIKILYRARKLFVSYSPANRDFSRNEQTTIERRARRVICSAVLANYPYKMTMPFVLFSRRFLIAFGNVLVLWNEGFSSSFFYFHRRCQNSFIRYGS